MPLEDAPGEEVHERIEELPHEELRGVEGAGGPILKMSRHPDQRAAGAEDDDVEGKEEARLFEGGPERLPRWIFGVARAIWRFA
jgi:hypothetical protein